MKKVVVSILVLTLLFIGCSKEKLSQTPLVSEEQENTDHMPLAIGNYWVYDYYTLDSLGNESFSNSDSVYINKDTTINGNKYFIIEGGSFAGIGIGNIIRNVNNSIVEYSSYDSTEFVRFTTNNIGSVFLTNTDSLSGYSYSYWVKKQDTTVVVGMENYVCYNMQQQVVNFIPGHPYPLRNFYRCYNSNVGVVINQFAYSASPFIFEGRLVRYNIN